MNLRPTRPCNRLNDGPPAPSPDQPRSEWSTQSGDRSLELAWPQRQAAASRRFGRTAAAVAILVPLAGCGTGSEGPGAARAPTKIPVQETALTVSELRQALLSDGNVSPYFRRIPPEPSSEDGWSGVAWHCLGMLGAFYDRREDVWADGVYLERRHTFTGLSQTLVSYPDDQAAADAMQKLQSALEDCPSDKGEATVGSEDTYEATARVDQPHASAADDELNISISIAQRDYGTLKILNRSRVEIVFVRAANDVMRLQTDVAPEGRRKQLLAVVLPVALHRLAAVARGDQPDDEPIELRSRR